MIGEGDFDATLAYDCLHLFHWPPSVTLRLSREEKAFVCAAVWRYGERE
ncbi:MAG: hypothetical protein LBH95_06715 [Oscillospiraceae bacterium]|jgi:hypothetical protein|nr:hypothetical protein [Oscillospiraceae bacterium]